MAAKKSSRPVGRPPDLLKKQAILSAGWALFLARGVDAVSLETVAERAGVSKATLYKHFPDKNSLFEAGVLQEMLLIESAQRAAPRPDGDASLEEVLCQFGFGILSFLCSPSAIDFYNSLAGELRRHPDLASKFYNLGPGRTKANLVSLLRAADTRGELSCPQPDVAAEHLFGLWQGFSNFQLSLGVDDEWRRQDLMVRVRNAVRIFLRAYSR